MPNSVGTPVGINTNGAGPYTLNITVPAGTKVLWVGWAARSGSGQTISAASSDVDGAFTLRVFNAGTSLPKMCVWYLLNPSAGAHTISLTPSASVSDGRAISLCIDDVDTTGTPFGTAASDADNVVNPSLDLSSAVGEKVLGFLAHEDPGGTTLTWDGTASEIIRQGAGSGTSFTRIASAIIDGAALTTLSATLSQSRNWKFWAIPLKPIPPSGGTELLSVLHHEG